MGALLHGAQGCTCWEATHDVEQQPVDELAVRLLAAGVTPVTRARMCEACAYRPGSPEMTGQPGYQGDPEELEHLAGASRFWCHVGIRRVVTWRHPSGVEADAHPAEYDPPIRGQVPYRADGSPAELCAGWAARRRALLARSREQ